MASWLEQQIAALQAQGIDVSPEALSAQIPQGYDQMPQQPASAPQPAAPQPSIWGGALTGAARDGLVGGLVGTFANPNTQAPQGEANAYQAVTGILRNVGRAIGSAYGNPNYAQAARAIDQRGMAIAQRGQQNQIENQMGLERLRQGQVDLGFKYAGEQRAAEKDRRLSSSAQAVAKVMEGHPGDPTAMMQAANIAFSLGDTELGTKLQEAAQKAGKAPEAPTVKDFYTPDGQTEQRQWNGSEWVTLGSGPRFQDPAPRAPVAIVGPDGNDVYVSPEQAIGKTPANQAESEITKATRTSLEKEQIGYVRDLTRLEDSIQGFDPNIFTYAGRGGRALQGAASSAGLLSEDAKAKLQEQAGYVQRISMLSAELIHNLYGGALTPGEEARANQFIVSQSDSPDQAIAKLRGLKAQYEAKIAANASALKNGVRGLGVQSATGSQPQPSQDTPQTKTLNGKTYVKVPGGWVPQ